MMHKHLLYLLLAATVIGAPACTHRSICTCATVDSAGHLSGAQRFDLGNASYARSVERCDAHRQDFDTCYLTVHR